MGNAIPKLKSVASEITDSVDNDGIAQSFITFIPAALTNW